jgi:hypothetical protein
MIHASPWRATLGLLRGAGNALRAQGLLYLYGPYRRGGRHTAPSNEEFDRSYLRARDPEWGIRDLEDVIAEAAAQRSLSQSWSRCPRTIYRSCCVGCNLASSFRGGKKQ